MDNITLEHVKTILSEQREYFEQGETKDIDFRIKQLIKLKKAIIDNETFIMDALYKDLHKPEFEAYATEIGYLLDSIGFMVKHLKSWAAVRRVKTPVVHTGSRSFIYYEPYGTVLIIGPFNYPFQLVLEPLIGAVSAGNCCVVKPSEYTPNISKVTAKIISDTFDKNYIRVIEGGKETTSALINSPFDYIFFTGSVPVGKIVMEAAAKNLVPVTLELGGKSPCIVDREANLQVSAKRIAWGKFMNAGQTCVALDYLLVHRDVRLIGLLDSDKIVLGGEYNIDNLYVSPTVMDNVTWEDRVMEDEIFGPILPVIEYENLDDAVKMINSRPKPLALYIFTENRETEEKAIMDTSYGGGCVNDTMTHLATPFLPFGGVGTSGIGSYHGEASFKTFSNLKSVLKRSTRFDLKFLYPPYSSKKVSLLRKFMK
jgi:aldehyde dehydrogenase (NAD+)